MARALVACGWFGIQTWIGALAVDTLMATLWNGWADIGGHKAIAFGAFWLIELAIILRGIEGIRWLERTAAPLLIGGSVALLIWGFDAGGGIGNVFSASSKLVTDDQNFWSLFAPGLAANIGYWITLSLNIPDFTRYARDQKSQVVGQSIAMPLTMTAFSFVGIAVTAATIVVYGEAIWDPVALVARLLDDLPILLVLAMIVIVIAQLSTNMAANVVSPSNDFSNLSPRQITFRTGGVITAVIGIVSLPWKLYEDVGAYIFTWLVGYGSLLAAFAGVMIVDYWIMRKTVLDVVELYRPGRPLLVHERLQRARARRRSRSACPGDPGLPQRRHDGGRRGGRPDVPRPALPLRRVRRVRAGRGLLLRDGPAARARSPRPPPRNPEGCGSPPLGPVGSAPWRTDDGRTDHLTPEEGSHVLQSPHAHRLAPGPGSDPRRVRRAPRPRGQARLPRRRAAPLPAVRHAPPLPPHAATGRVALTTTRGRAYASPMNLRRLRKQSEPPTIYVGDYMHKLSRIRPLEHDDDDRQRREDREYGKGLFSDPPLPSFLTGVKKPPRS